MDSKNLHEKIAEASRTIFSYCRARTDSREDAEDLSQDILCELLRSVGSLRDERAFYAFMWGVAGNVYKQWLRRKSRAETADLPEEIPAEKPEPADDAEIALLRRELSLLAEKYRRAVILYYIDGKSCRQIAQTLSVSESMVKYLLFKSRKILKEGMNMERVPGALSYNPKSLIPLYSGSGPNCFLEFMQSRIRQNILGACYNDALTPAQISLETGIPLPYLDDEIRIMEEKAILAREGGRYKANIILITADCIDEMERSAAAYHERIADAVSEFLDRRLGDFRAIGFRGAEYSENTLRWQLAVLVFRAVLHYDAGRTLPPRPTTAWGDSAYIWCMEKMPGKTEPVFRYSGMDSRTGDSLYFFDYVPNPKGDHHDFYGNERYVNIFCDIVRGETAHFSEYDREAAEDMIRRGYVRADGDSYTPAVLVYTTVQYEAARELAAEFVERKLGVLLREMEDAAVRILADHTPKHLQPQVPGIAAQDKFIHGVSIPAAILVKRGGLRTDWHPAQMPTTYVVLQ